jgi:hypothetical protein
MCAEMWSKISVADCYVQGVYSTETGGSGLPKKLKIKRHEWIDVLFDYACLYMAEHN